MKVVVCWTRNPLKGWALRVFASMDAVPDEIMDNDEEWVVQETEVE